MAGHHQRRGAIAGGLVHLGVRGEQLRGDLGVALLAGEVQRRGAISQGLVHVGVRSNQRRDDRMLRNHGFCGNWQANLFD